MEQLHISTPLGWMLAQADDTSLLALRFDEPQTPPLAPHTVSNPVLQLLAQELEAYFAHRLTRFTVPLAGGEGTPLQIRVWGALQEIPYGQTCTYAELAAALGKPKAVRPVAAANGQNPWLVIVPCHRVIGSQGQLIGYAGELWRKEYLLHLEQGGIQTQLF